MKRIIESLKPFPVQFHAGYHDKATPPINFNKEEEEEEEDSDTFIP
jgi:hypothetical protein